ncbi:MAG: glycosyltransferase [Bacteroidetes bacterium]|nr:glycosyltransferase [Bacteroidota bacterium]
MAPLDWGMGHSARCVPLIQQLQKQNNQIVVACTPEQKKFLEQELFGVQYTLCFGYRVRYSKVIPLWLKLFWQAPRLLLLIKKEQQWLQQYTNNNDIDLIISDNRFGLYHSSIPSIFITHQLNIQTPILKKASNRVHFFFLKKYHRIWVPDYAEKEKRLSGILSEADTRLQNITFINPLSRLKKHENTNEEKKYDVLLLLSGAEPQRSLLEQKLLFMYKDASSLKIALVRGSSAETKKNIPKNVTVYPYASSKQLQHLLEVSKKIICRSGYSTLMDLHAVEKKATLIPTPGQSEQEYLARYWHEKFDFEWQQQKKLQ